jgi:hypothetical protein
MCKNLCGQICRGLRFDQTNTSQLIMSPLRLFFALCAVAAAAIGFFMLTKPRLEQKQAMKARRNGYMKTYVDSIRTAQDLYKDSVRRVQYGLPPSSK